MALMDLIEHRHSIRGYLDKPVEREKIVRCLEAAPGTLGLQFTAMALHRGG